MKYLFVSDAHGDIEILKKIFSVYNKQVNKIFYNGDSELLASDALFTNVLAVQGNMDFDQAFPIENVYQGTDITIFQTHGHLLSVNFTLNELINVGQKNNASVITFGHTHRLGVEKIGDIVLLNPGSISQPRGVYAKYGGTFAVLTVEDKNYKIEYFDRNLTLLNELTTKFSR